MSYVDAKYTRNLVSVLGTAPINFGTYPDTPKWSGSVFGEASYPISSNLAVSFRSDVFGQARDWFSGTGNIDPSAQLPAYFITNFRVGLDNTRAGWSLSANLKRC